MALRILDRCLLSRRNPQWAEARGASQEYEAYIRPAVHVSQSLSTRGRDEACPGAFWRLTIWQVGGMQTSIDLRRANGHDEIRICVCIVNRLCRATRRMRGDRAKDIVVQYVEPPVESERVAQRDSGGHQLGGIWGGSRKEQFGKPGRVVSSRERSLHILGRPWWCLYWRQRWYMLQRD